MTRQKDGNFFVANIKQTVHTHVRTQNKNSHRLWKQIYIIFHKFLFEFCFSTYVAYFCNKYLSVLWELTVVLYLLKEGFESS